MCSSPQKSLWLSRLEIYEKVGANLVAVDPPVTIYMSVNTQSGLTLPADRSKGVGTKSKVSFWRTCPVPKLKLKKSDEELLRYGLPTDIWFHVE